VLLQRKLGRRSVPILTSRAGEGAKNVIIRTNPQKFKSDPRSNTDTGI
jgi:hypothetical protein